jgi:PAS domain S-box-containing protein
MNKNIKNIVNDNKYNIAVLILVLTVTFYVWTYSLSVIENNIEKKFFLSSEKIEFLINEQVKDYTKMLVSIKAFYNASIYVDRNEFNEFISSQNIERLYQGIIALEYVEKVPFKNKESFIQRVRNDGFKDFDINPDEEREEYLVINYIEPFIGNEQVFGFDLASDEEQLDALLRSRDTKELIVTSSVQADGDFKVFLMVLPIYDNTESIITLEDRRVNLKGFVLALIDADKFFSDVLKNDEFKHFHLSVNDNVEELFNNDRYFESVGLDLNLSSDFPIEIGGRIWNFSTHPTEGFVEDFIVQKSISFLILFIGITFGSFLFFILFIIYRAKRKSDELAEEMTQNFKMEKNKVENINKELKKAIIFTEQSKIDVENSFKKEKEAKKEVLNTLKEVQIAKNEISKEKDKINTIVKSIGDAVFVVDKDYKLLLMNRVAEELSGFSAKEAIGKKYSETLKFVYESDGSVNDSFIKKVFETGEVQSMTNHTLIVNKSGKKIPVADSAAPLKDKKGNVYGCVAVFRDVTKEQEIDRIKNEFISIASHQLRTPLTGIRWVIERFMKNMGQFSKKDQEYLKSMEVASAQLTILIDQLLNVSRIESGGIGIVPTKIDVVASVRGVINELLSISESRGVTVTFNSPEDKIIIETDVNALHNIVQSIASNAIEYTSEGGQVSVTVEKDKDTFSITVTDTGIGIPKEEIPKLFTKFKRAENAKKFKPSGTGLGLFIVKQAIDLLGGDVSIESEVGKGSTFHVNLPLSSKEKAGEKRFV